MNNESHVTMLEPSDGGSVDCPELPGRHSHGANGLEASENIRDGIHGHLETYGEPELHCEIRKLELTPA